MSHVAVIGSAGPVLGYALAGARMLIAETPAEVRRCWTGLPADVTVVLLTAEAAGALGSDCLAASPLLTVVLP